MGFRFVQEAKSFTSKLGRKKRRPKTAQGAEMVSNLKNMYEFLGTFKHGITARSSSLDDFVAEQSEPDCPPSILRVSILFLTFLFSKLVMDLHNFIL